MKRLFAILLGVVWTAAAYAAGPPMPSAPPINLYQPNITGSATVRQVTSRTAIPMIISGSNTQISARSWQVAYVPVSALQVCIANYYTGSSVSGVETTSGGTATVHIVVAYAGSYVDLTWGGLTSGTVSALTNGCTDLTALGFTIQPFSRFSINAYITWSGGGKAVYSSWSNACDRANGDDFAIGTALTDHTKDTASLGANPANCWHPAAVMALSNRSVWWLEGDSIVAGVNDMGADPSGGRGLLGRAAAALGPTLNYGIPGDRAQWYAANGTLRTQLAALAGATSALLELGVNDFYSGARTADNVLTDRSTIRANNAAAIPGLKTFDTTVTPETTSTDGWNTTANQTPVSATGNNTRAAFNDFLRGLGSFIFNGTCTTTASSASVTGCTGLSVTTVANGMNATSANWSGSLSISAVNQYAGTLTLSGNATTGSAVGINFSWPTFTNSFPTTSAGLADIARLIECSPNQAAIQVANGGVWCPGFVGQTDGIHPSHFADITIQQLLTNQLAVLR